MLWSADHVAGFTAVLATPIVAVVSPPLASLVVMTLAAVRLGERLGFARPTASATVATTAPPSTSVARPG